MCESMAPEETPFRLHVAAHPGRLRKPLHTVFRMNNPQCDFEPEATARQKEGVVLD
jgi:hypothetical protein